MVFFFTSDATCQYISKDRKTCSLHNDKFGEILTILTASLLLVSILLDCLVVYFVKDLEIFDANDKAYSLQRNHSMRDDFSRPTSVQPMSEASTLEQRRPPRPRSSVRHSSVETEPLTSGHNSLEPEERRSPRMSFQPQGSDGRPLSNQNAQRDLIEEFRQLKSTQI